MTTKQLIWPKGGGFPEHRHPPGYSHTLKVGMNRKLIVNGRVNGENGAAGGDGLVMILEYS